MEKKKLKIHQLERVSKDKIGRISTNGVDLEVHEYSTILLLAEYGFDIECIKKNHTPKTRNADILMLGTIWEMKSPESSNPKTLKKRIHTALLQSSHIIFDLRRIKSEHQISVEKELLKRFQDKSAFRRIVLIRNKDEILDIIK